MRKNMNMPSYPGLDKEARESMASKTNEMRLRGNEAIQRGGGEDHRRPEMRNVIERKVRDHDMSGFNHRDEPEMSLSDRDMRPSKDDFSKREGSMMYADGIRR